MRLSLLPRPAAPAAAASAVRETLAEQLRAADAERLERYRAFDRFYAGHHWDHLPAATGTAERRARLTLNYGRAIVDKGVSYLLGRGVNYAVPGDAAAEALLYRVADENGLGALDLQGATNGAVLGDCVFKVTWDPRQAGPAAIRVANLDPRAFFPAWSADDPGRLEQVHLVYERPDGSTLVERWTAEALAVWVDGRQVQGVANPYAPLLPFVHVPNLPAPNSAWGTSDLRDILPLNRELNARLSDAGESIRFHADPPVIFRGVQEHSDLAVGAGTVWDVPGDADVHLLEWRGQPPSVQAHVELLFRALYEVAETPRTSFGDSGRLLSGVALETELRPLIMRTLRKRLFWEAGLRQRARLVLALARRFGLLPAGSALGEPPGVRVLWPPLLPKDDAGEVQANIALVQAGLRSRLTALDALGAESPEDELARIAAEGAPVARGDGSWVVGHGEDAPLPMTYDPRPSPASAASSPGERSEP